MIARLALDVLGGLLVGALTIVLAISFTSIVFTGPLSVFLDRGIGTTLLAASIMAAIGAIFFSYRGTITTPQDLTAIILSGAAASIASTLQASAPDEILATVLLLLAVSAAAAGLAMICLGAFQLSHVIRFIPYPVMGGFLAATGYLLMAGAIGMLVDVPVRLSQANALLEPLVLRQWLPWLLVSAIIVLSVRRLPNRFTLPICIAATCVGFYVILFFAGISLDAAAQAGLLLGPFSSGGFLDDLNPTFMAQAHWSLVADQSVTILVVVAMAVLGGGLNLSGIELATQTEMQPDRDFMTMGFSNLLAFPSGGLIGFPGIAATMLGFRLGLRGALAGLMVSGVCLSALLFGANLLEIMPRGLFAAVIGFLGLDLLVTWLWSVRKQLIARDYSVVFLILAVSATFGFILAIALGLAMSVLLFVISYMQLDFLRLKSDLTLRRSTTERDIGELNHLAHTGHQVRVFEFVGYLFFGTAAKFKAMFDEMFDGSARLPERVILDFSQVSGIDPSAAQSLRQVIASCATKEITPIVSGLRGSTRDRILTGGNADTLQLSVYQKLNEALLAEEERLLASRKIDGVEGPSMTFLDFLKEQNPDVTLEDHFERVSIPKGDYLFRRGEKSDEMYILMAGLVEVTIRSSNDVENTLSVLRPGSLIGEIAYFGDATRSADIRAAEDLELLCIPRARLEALVQTHPSLAASIFKLSAKYLSMRMERITRLISVLLD